MSVRLSIVVCLTYWTRYAGVQSGEVKVTWLMGDVGVFALILYNRSPGGVGAQLPSSWSSDLGCSMAQQLVKRPLGAQWLSNWSSDLGYSIA